MPFYNYRCKECGKETEVRHGMEEHPPVMCETEGCEGVTAKVPSRHTAFEFRESKSVDQFASPRISLSR